MTKTLWYLHAIICMTIGLACGYAIKGDIYTRGILGILIILIIVITLKVVGKAGKQLEETLEREERISEMLMAMIDLRAVKFKEKPCNHEWELSADGKTKTCDKCKVGIFTSNIKAGEEFSILGSAVPYGWSKENTKWPSDSSNGLTGGPVNIKCDFGEIVLTDAFGEELTTPPNLNGNWIKSLPTEEELNSAIRNATLTDNSGNTITNLVNNNFKVECDHQWDFSDGRCIRCGIKAADAYREKEIEWPDDSTTFIDERGVCPACRIFHEDGVNQVCSEPGCNVHTANSLCQKHERELAKRINND